MKNYTFQIVQELITSDVLKMVGQTISLFGSKMSCNVTMKYKLDQKYKRLVNGGNKYSCVSLNGLLP